MSLKTIIGSSLGLVVLSGGLTYYTNHQYKTEVGDKIAEANVALSPMMSLSYNVTSSGVFSVDDEITVTLNEKEMNGNASDSEQAVVKITNACTILPLIVNCDSKLVLPSEATAKLAEHDVAEIDYDMGWSMNYWADTIAGHFVMQPFDINANTNAGEAFALNVRGIDIKFEGEAGGEALASVGKINGMKFTAENRNFDIGLISFDSDAKRLGDQYLLGTSDMTFHKLRINTPEEVVALDNYTINTNTTLSDDEQKLNVSAVMALEALNIDAETNPLKTELKDAKLAIELNNLNKDIFAQPMYHDEPLKQMEHVVQLLGEDGLTVKLNQLSGVFNEVKLDSNAQIDVAPFTFADTQTPYGLLERVTFSLDALASQNLVTVFANIKPMIDQFQQQQMVIQNKEGNFTTTVKFADGALTANDKLLRQVF
ncbi:DUF945 family protein [Flocculibacter collagenilyticus]|uniref:DUF945 family protein n=1 Tax=Flocculibacter collagenilyticus TaxID=2744479 RepID=UPI0018F64B6A|nr:DUF945 family protein [Flocculibacter collagenilyticus]